MNLSDYIAGYLSPKTQRAFAASKTKGEGRDNNEPDLLDKVIAGLKAKTKAKAGGQRDFSKAKASNLVWSPLKTPVSAPQWTASEAEKFLRLVSRLDDLDGVCS